MENYHYPESQEGKPYKDEPVALHNHLLDAFRYLAHSYNPQENMFNITQQSGGIPNFYPELGI